MSSPPAAAPRTRGFKKKERTRRHLLRAAVEEIAINGEAFTILDVTRRAEVSNGTFYNYFDDRDALVEAVITEVVASFVDTAAGLVEVDDPVRRFAAITALLLEQSVTNPKLATVLLRLHTIGHTDVWPDDPFRYMRDDLVEAAQRGRLTTEPTDAVIDLVTGTLMRAVMRITTVGATADYRTEVVLLLLETFGLDASEAATVAAEAVALAPELGHAYRAADELQS
ncbi:MAG: TetR/AcrR family transcriptional regulator [Actinomycetota bacterium]